MFLGHGLVVETNLGYVDIRRSILDRNQGNGVKVKFLDGRYALFDELLTFCRMANLAGQTFPQTIIGIPSLSTSCARVRYSAVLLNILSVIFQFCNVMKNIKFCFQHQ